MCIIFICLSVSVSMSGVFVLTFRFVSFQEAFEEKKKCVSTPYICKNYSSNPVQLTLPFETNKHTNKHTCIRLLCTVGFDQGVTL